MKLLVLARVLVEPQAPQLVQVVVLQVLLVQVVVLTEILLVLAADVYLIHWFVGLQ